MHTLIHKLTQQSQRSKLDKQDVVRGFASHGRHVLLLYCNETGVKIFGKVGTRWKGSCEMGYTWDTGKLINTDSELAAIDMTF